LPKYAWATSSGNVGFSARIYTTKERKTPKKEKKREKKAKKRLRNQKKTPRG
jgi:hypothetical protein